MNWIQQGDASGSKQQMQSIGDNSVPDGKYPDQKEPDSRFLWKPRAAIVLHVHVHDSQ